VLFLGRITNAEVFLSYIVAAEMDVFAGHCIAVEFAMQTSFKTKQQLRQLITDHGGTVSFIVTRKVILRYFQLMVMSLTILLMLPWGEGIWRL